ncbi:unnamed protein product [Lactuca saligna]|uniref:Uncharacterized protein n=1 Tax=Lactuca saligna TaxID=75948 RepID=A0AA36EC38_LACSI|nr:unnamed protein product [Lactuca saligna]
MFCQRLFNAFAHPTSIMTSDPPASTATLVVPLYTKDPLDPTNVINLDSLIPDVDVMHFYSAIPFPGSSSSEILSLPKMGGTLPYFPTSLPILVSVASSLPSFLHPFASNMIFQLLSLGNMINEEEEFIMMNATLQSAAIELGLNRYFLEMKIKYSVELDGKEVLYSYPNVEDVILQRFFDLTNYDYPFLKMLNADSMDASLLKKHLEDSDVTTDDD